MKVLVIDNYDSFVYNLCDYIGRLGVTDIEIYRNDAISVEQALKRSPDAIVISPGPGKPQEAGISIELIKASAPDIPLLGVCLGHQSIAAAFGGSIIRADRIFHGKTSLINHSEREIFEGIGNPFEATRYHSLIIDEKGFPGDLEVTAKTDENEIMGIRHREYLCYGVQFHPESILTKEGLKLIENFLRIASKQ